MLHNNAGISCDVPRGQGDKNVLLCAIFRYLHHRIVSPFIEPHSNVLPVQYIYLVVGLFFDCVFVLS